MQALVNGWENRPLVGLDPRLGHENLYEATALAYFALGLFTGTYSGFTVLVGRTQVPGLRLQVPIYGVAALFGVFAFLNSIGYIIPLSPTMAKWHFWLSFVGVTRCGSHRGHR